MPSVIHFMRLLRWPVPIHVHFELPVFLRKLMERPIQPLVATSVRVRQIIAREDGEPDSLVTVLEFNDEHANSDDPEHVDLIQLRSSLDESGTFFIWTCSCGARDAQEDSTVFKSPILTASPPGMISIQNESI